MNALPVINSHYSELPEEPQVLKQGSTLFGYLKVDFAHPPAAHAHACCCVFNDTEPVSLGLLRRLLQGCSYPDRGCWRVEAPQQPEGERIMWMEGARVEGYQWPLLYLDPSGPPVMPAACARFVILKVAQGVRAGQDRPAVFELWWDPWDGPSVPHFNTPQALATEVEDLNAQLEAMEEAAPPLRLLPLPK